MRPTNCITQAELSLAGQEALLIDVREPGEFASERLPGSLNVPLSRLDAEASRLPKDKPLVVVCRSGRRALDAARRLSALGFADVRILDGGLQCCVGVEKGERGVWAMERQVRMAAGLLVLSGAVLAWLVRPEFLLLSAGVGAGLVFSAATDTCGMAALLARLPWNKAPRN
ncbi:MAG: rhodanese-like domain-containing protein [Elusimicrobia bacterium]|nr:rhodanese-like domain-containing protein [Elusimicrobiota bacterium]